MYQGRVVRIRYNIVYFATWHKFKALVLNLPKNEMRRHEHLGVKLKEILGDLWLCSQTSSWEEVWANLVAIHTFSNINWLLQLFDSYSYFNLK